MDNSRHEVAVEHGDKVEEPGSQELQAMLLLRGVEAHVRQFHARILQPFTRKWIQRHLEEEKELKYLWLKKKLSLQEKKGDGYLKMTLIT